MNNPYEPPGDPDDPGSFGGLVDELVSAPLRDGHLTLWVALVVAAPAALPGVAFHAWGAEGPVAATIGHVLTTLGLVPGVACWLVAWQAAARAETLDTGELLARAWRPMGWFVVWQLLYSVAVNVGVLLLVVPGVVVGAAFFLMDPVVVIEERGAGTPRRCLELVHGQWGTNLSLFGFMLMLSIVVTALDMMIGDVSDVLLPWRLAILVHTLLGTGISVAFALLATTMTWSLWRHARHRAGEGTDV